MRLLAKDWLWIVLGQISDPQLSFSVQRTQPATINDTVAATLELQAHLKLANSSVQPHPNSAIAAVSDSRSRQQPPPDRTTSLLEQLASRMEKLEMELRVQQHHWSLAQTFRRTNRYEQHPQQSPQQTCGPVVC